MAGFTKLFSSIVDSTIWREDACTKVVWVTLLAKADRNGNVNMSLPGLADAARVELPQCEAALVKFLSPDPYSRTKDFDGRRIMEIEGGWTLLNYSKYRKIRDEDEERIATLERVRRHREKLAIEKGVTQVTQSNKSNAIAEAEAETESEAKDKSAAPPVAEQTPLPLMGEPKRKSRQSKNGPKLTDLKPESVKAFEAAWETTPPTAMQRVQTFPGKWTDQEVPVQRGSRAQAERNFQSIVDAGHATPRELYAAFFVYAQGPRNGFYQHLSTFYGPEKATWREYLTQAREAIAEQDAEKA